MSKIIINFWNGNIPLWKSYWIVGELLNAIVIFLIFNFEIKYLNNTLSGNIITFINFNNFSLISKFIVIMWSIFITIGIWRSAENYKGNFIWIILTLFFLSYRIFTLRIIFF